MPRKYKPNPDGRTYCRYSEERLEAAIIEVIEGRLSMYTASKQFKILYGTIYNKFNGLHARDVGAPRVINKAAEERIVKCIQICGEWGYPLDRDDLRYFVQIYLKSKGGY